MSLVDWVEVDHKYRVNDRSPWFPLAQHMTARRIWRRSLMVLAQLETVILDALASIRCNELFPGFHYGHEFEGLCFRH